MWRGAEARRFYRVLFPNVPRCHPCGIQSVPINSRWFYPSLSVWTWDIASWHLLFVIVSRLFCVPNLHHTISDVWSLFAVTDWACLFGILQRCLGSHVMGKFVPQCTVMYCGLCIDFVNFLQACGLILCCGLHMGMNFICFFVFFVHNENRKTQLKNSFIPFIKQPLKG